MGKRCFVILSHTVLNVCFRLAHTPRRLPFRYRRLSYGCNSGCSRRGVGGGVSRGRIFRSKKVSIELINLKHNLINCNKYHYFFRLQRESGADRKTSQTSTHQLLEGGGGNNQGGAGNAHILNGMLLIIFP